MELEYIGKINKCSRLIALAIPVFERKKNSVRPIKEDLVVK